jgi:hypothetical protein
MKDLFPGYYSPSDEEFSELWQQCIFIFDTNVFLAFYEYNDEICEDFFKALEAIKSRLWIPHQVALEYHKNRINKIKKAESNFDDIEKRLNDIKSNLLKDLNSFKCLPSESSIEEMIKDIEKAVNTFCKQLIPLKDKVIKINGEDYIRDKVTYLFQKKIGELPANQEELDQIYLEGEQRYKICRPPGFKDQEKNKYKDNYYTHKGLVFKREYGDLIVWKQILKQVKSKSLTYIIFITGDAKEDWWRIEKGKKMEPHPELIQEIIDAGTSMFYMYSPERFLELAGKYLQVEIKEESIQQVEEVSVSNSLSKPELRGNFSRELSAIDGYGLNNIERLVAANNPLSNIERLVAAANNPLSSIADFAKQLSAAEAMRLTNIDKYGFINNIAVACIMAEQDRFMASVNQFVENNNRVIAQMVKQAAIPKQAIPYVHRGINSEYLTDSNASQEVESSED